MLTLVDLTSILSLIFPSVFLAALTRRRTDAHNLLASCHPALDIALHDAADLPVHSIELFAFEVGQGFWAHLV